MPLSLSFQQSDHNHEHCIERALERAEELCRVQRQRLTAQRRRVLELVWAQHKPVGAYAVLEELQKQGRAAPPTVYRALEFLQQMGLVHKIESLNAYVGCAFAGQPHDAQFLICEQCDELAEVEIPRLSETLNEGAAISGFEPRRSTIEVLGLCPNCLDLRP